jgi:DNA-directed RNA polymerase specialized sigma24 family protein
MKEYRNGWNNALDLGPAAANLSEDLEWVLQSGQSDPGLVAEGLLRTYDAPVLRLCMALENQPERARELHRQIFARAVSQAYRYSSKVSIPLWFYTCLLQALPRAILRERRAHLPVLLHVFADLDAEQVAALFKLKPERAQTRLSKLEKDPQAVLQRAGLPVEVIADLQAGTNWRQALLQHYPAPDLEDETLEAMAHEIVEQAEKSNVIRRRWVLLQELALLLLAALAVAVLIMAADSFSPPPTSGTTP